MKVVSVFLVITALLEVGTPSKSFAQVKDGHEMEVIGKSSKAEKILADNFPPGSRHEFAMVTMRDGVKLATDFFIPPGNGPWPVVFTTGYYSRLAGQPGAKAKEGQVVYIIQDARGTYDSQGKEGILLTAPDQEMNDCSDSLDWIAAQKWCNGKIGMTGASGNAVGPFAAFLSKNPHLFFAAASISSPWPYYYWGFHNGVRRYLYGWLSHAAWKVTDWPAPTIPSYDPSHWKKILSSAGDKNAATLMLSSGWYDISPEATVDAFAALASKCTVVAVISAGGHGSHCPFTWPRNPTAKQSPPIVPSVFDVVTGKVKAPDKSVLAYFLMGNFRDPASPGNCFKTTNVWPVPNTPTPYYMHADGGLSTAKPAEAEATMTYAYDPKDPAPALNIKEMLNSGPFDQRPLKDRKDVLHFTSAPIEAPLEITGKIIADLYVSTDVPDTEFVVKFIDIQPDGYEMLIREAPVLARYAEEFRGKPAPLERGKVYQLTIDLRSTAILIDKGHRLGVLITSSSKPEYEVHPNTFNPVTSFDQSPIAHQAIHLSSRYPSSITLPIITEQK